MFHLDVDPTQFLVASSRAEVRVPVVNPPHKGGDVDQIAALKNKLSKKDAVTVDFVKKLNCKPLHDCS